MKKGGYEKDAKYRVEKYKELDKSMEIDESIR